MLNLEADNRQLINSQKYSYLVTNYTSGINSFSVLNATDTPWATNAFLLLGNFGAEDAEILKILTVNNNTGAITTTANTNFAHSESTRVTILPYDQIRFFHTTTTTFGTGTPLTSYINIQPSDWFSTFSDETYSTGYGWYTFYNSQTTTLSQESNPIPYSGFENDTVSQILDDFFSLLSNKELRLVTREDALSWANEAYGRMRNKLNLTNVEYTATDITPLQLIPGQTEYDLPDSFDHLISFISGLDPTNPGINSGGAKIDIDFIPLTKAFSYNGTGPRYYIRNFKIGILPTPSTSVIYHYIYQKTANKLTLNSSEVDLPAGGSFIIKDYMLYRAYTKFQNFQAAKISMDAFTAGLSDMIVSSVKRDANLDTWGITKEANV